MARGAYNMGNGSVESPFSKPDNSFKSFICVLLIFLAICLVIFLVLFNWKQGTKEVHSEVLHDKGNKPGGHEFEKIQMEITSITKTKGTTSWSDKSYSHTPDISESFKSVTPPTNNIWPTEQLESSSTEDASLSSDQTFNSKSSSPTESVLTTINITTNTIRPITYGITASPDHTINSTRPDSEGTTSSSSKGSYDTPVISESSDGVTLPSTDGLSMEPAESSPSSEDESSIREALSDATMKSTQKPAPSSTTETLISNDVNDGQDLTPTESDSNDSKQDPLPENNDPECQSSECRNKLGLMLALMNHEEDPCTDFYEFACGGRGSDYLLSGKGADLNAVTIISSYLNNNFNSIDYRFLKVFKTFKDNCIKYHSSIDYVTKMKNVRKSVDDVGKFSTINSIVTSDEITDLVAALIQRQSMPLFDIGLGIDRKSGNIILQLTLPQRSSLPMGLKDWSGLALHRSRCLVKQSEIRTGNHIFLKTIYDSYKKCLNNYAGYLNDISKVLQELDFPLNEAEIQSIRWAVETAVLEKLTELPQLTEIKKNLYRQKKIEDLQNDYPFLNWIKLLTKLTGRTLEKTDEIQVYFVNYFAKLFNDSSTTDLNNALLAIYAYDTFLNTVTSKSEDHYCLNLALKVMPDIASYLSLIVYSEDQRSKWVNSLNFESLRQKFCKSLNQKWLDSTSQNIMNEKCENIILMLNEERLEKESFKYYDEIHISDNFLENFIKLLIESRTKAWSLIRERISPKIIFSRFLNPMSSEPFSDVSQNFIALPYGLMEQDFIDLPIYLAKPQIFRLAKELGKIFDRSATIYEQISCESKLSHDSLINDSPNITGPSVSGRHGTTYEYEVDGALSADERILENTAFRLVSDDSLPFIASSNVPWKSLNYSQEKFFFISIAQQYCEEENFSNFMMRIFEGPHLPGRLLVKNIMQNSKQFGKSFECYPGSAMQTDPEWQLQFPYLKVQEDDCEESK